MKILNKAIHAFENRLSGSSVFSVKQLLLKSVVLIFCIFGFPCVLVSSWEVWRQGKPQIALIYIAVYLLLFSGYLFEKRLSYQWRTGMVLFPLVCSGCP